MSEKDDDLQFIRERLYDVQAENQRIESILMSARDFVEGKVGAQMSAEHVEQLRQLRKSA